MQRVFQVRRPYWDHVKVKKKNQKGTWPSIGKQIFEKQRERGGVIYSGGIPVAFTMNNIKMTWGETGEIMAKGKAKLMRSPGSIISPGWGWRCVLRNRPLNGRLEKEIHYYSQPKPGGARAMCRFSSLP